MKYVFSTILAVALLNINPAVGQPRIYSIGIVFTDIVDQETLPLHLKERHPAIIKTINQEIRQLFSDLNRFRTLHLQSSGDVDDPLYHGARSVDYIAHFTLSKAYKTYHNQILHYYDGEDERLQFDDGGGV